MAFQMDVLDRAAAAVIAQNLNNILKGHSQAHDQWKKRHYSDRFAEFRCKIAIPFQPASVSVPFAAGFSGFLACPAPVSDSPLAAAAAPPPSPEKRPGPHSEVEDSPEVKKAKNQPKPYADCSPSYQRTLRHNMFESILEVLKKQGIHVKDEEEVSRI